MIYKMRPTEIWGPPVWGPHISLKIGTRQWRTVENREYSVVHGVHRVQEHWGTQRTVENSTWSTGTLGNTEDSLEQRVQCSTWSTESTGTQRTVENRGTQRTVENGRNTEGTQRTVENGIEQRVQRSTWSTERTGTLGEHRGQ